MWIWLVVAGLAAIGELLSYDLFLAPVAVAALVVAFVAPFSALPFQIGLFAGLSLLGIMFLRPIIRHALGLDTRTGDTDPVGHANVVGRRGIVTQSVHADSGQIRIGKGEFWTARPFDPAHTFARGDLVDVLLVDGIAALVDAAPAVPPLYVTTSQTPIQKGIES